MIADNVIIGEIELDRRGVLSGAGLQGDAFRPGTPLDRAEIGSPLFWSHRDHLGPLLLQHKLAAICEWREMTASGCLASYGTTLREGAAMQAALIDKMLKGVRPGDTPAQQPTRFELVLNQKTARAIGIEIPPAMLARADEVIE